MTSSVKGGGAAVQLELFEPQSLDRPRYISVEEARAQVSPGWWPILAPLLMEGEVAVTSCIERQGRLMLTVTTGGRRDRR